MVHRLSRVRGFHLHGPEGELGHIDDFLIDEEHWQIRYLVVDTSNWIGGKWVAISPSEVRRIDWADRILRVDLTRQQVRSSPTMEDVKVPSYEMMPPVFIM